MYLSRLELENFRGIRSASIDLGDTTVMIGENDSGKTTLLEAVLMILSPIPEDRPLTFISQDFFMVREGAIYKSVGALKIRLTFRERKSDEWSFMHNNDFGLSLPDKEDTLQELTLEVAADPPMGKDSSPGRWRIIVEGKNRLEFTDDPAVLAWIRRLNPVFRVKGNMLFNIPSDVNAAENPDKGTNPGGSGGEKLAATILNSYRKITSGDMENLSDELHIGYQAAMQYLAKTTHMFFQDGPALEQIIYEILGSKQPEQDPANPKVVLRRGSAAEKIGMLLFTMSILQSGSLMADPSAEPIIIIEDPEAHLHPMTLESVKLLIERLKWQKIITTQSGSLLSGFPLEEVRRITRHNGIVRQHWVRPGSLSSEDLRRLSYHVRMRMSTATFARCWLLVEGESEIWLLPHLARLCGYDLALEGVVCVEFAQCGIAPLIKAASLLGIQWYLLADGDAAGKAYINTARHFALQSRENPDDHSLRFREKDIEHHLYFSGYAGVYQYYSGTREFESQNMQPRRIIGRAIHRNSKPFMAVAVIEAIARKDSPGVPPILRKVIESSIRLAKSDV